MNIIDQVRRFLSSLWTDNEWASPRGAQDDEKLEADVTIGYKLGTRGFRNPMARCRFHYEH